MSATIVKEIAAKIDSEIHRIVEEAYKDVTKLLSENEKFLHDTWKCFVRRGSHRLRKR